MTNTPSDIQEVSDFYELMRNYWIELSGFGATDASVMLNFGYWSSGTLNLHDAQHALVRKLVAALPPSVSGGTGVEIGCGIGGISISVLKLLPSARMVGVDISLKQLALAQRNGLDFGVSERFYALQGDSMDLPCADAEFDFSLCIESSFHYIDKASFFSECFRTLRPGGVAIVADITCSNPEGVRFRHGNHFESVDHYRQCISATGFKLLCEEDIGPQVYAPLYNHVLKFNGRQRSAVSRYWSRVLSNYLQLAEVGEMGYHFFVVQKPLAAPLHP